MTHERLLNLATISTESDILREIDVTTIINDLLWQNRERCLVFECRLCDFNCVGLLDVITCRQVYMHYFVTY